MLTDILTIRDILEILDGAGIVVTDDDLVDETLREQGFVDGQDTLLRLDVSE